MSDETGWEFETIKRVYANFGVDRNGESTGTAWKIVTQSPASTALKAEEVRIEKMSFSIEPRDGNRFKIKATMHYQYAPVPQHGPGQEVDATKMAQTSLILRGKRPS